MRLVELESSKNKMGNEKWKQFLSTPVMKSLERKSS